MATNWRTWDRKGTFEVTAQAEAWALPENDLGGDPRGELRALPPGTHTVTEERQATAITNDPDRGGVGSVAETFYIVDTGDGERVAVSSIFGSFTPEQ